MANTYELIVKTVDQSSRTLTSIDSSLNRLGRTAKAAGVALAGIATGRIVGGIISQYRAYEQYRTVLTTFLGSQEKANAELERLQVLANSLPQDLQDITQSFTILQRNGIDTTSKSLTAFSNIATANAKSFTQLSEAIADALTGEFERLKEFGIKVSKENDKFVARIGDQQVAVASTTTDLVAQLRKLGEEGGRFGGAAAANADTLNQSYSNLQGAIFQTSVTIGTELKPALKEAADLTANWLQTHQELIKALSGRLGEGLITSIEVSAKALEILAANIDLVRNVALTYLGIRFANSFVNLVTKISSAVKATQTLSGALATAATVAKNQSWIVRMISGLGSLATRLVSFAGIGSIVRGAFIAIGAAIGAVTGPILAVVAAVAAVAGGVYYFRNSVVQLGATTSSVGEIVKAVWWQIGESVKGLGDVAVNIFRFLVDGAVSVGESIERALGGGWDWVSDRLSSFGNKFIEVFQYLVEIAKTRINIMIGLFAGMFQWLQKNIVNIPAFFADAFVATLNVAGSFVSRLGGVFGELWDYIKSGGDDAIENTFSGFGQEIKDQVSLATSNLESIDWNAALNTDYVGYAIDATAKKFNELTITIKEGVVTTLEDLVLRYREANAVSTETATATGEVAAAVTEVATSATQASAALEGMLSKYQEAVKAINEFNKNRIDVSNGMKLLEQDFLNGKYTLEEFKVGMGAMGASMDDISNRSIAMGLTITEAFQSAGDSLARGLARGIARGENIMDSFKNFMQTILEEILYQIIQQAFIKPMIASITSGFNTAFSAFGAGGAGAFGGGAFGGGGLLGAIFGIGRLFLGFAGGGVVPGMATQGDSVPVLATPGEVILNKRQQSSLLSGDGTGEPITVNFNINAIDTRSGTQFILENKAQITSVIQQAYNQRGRGGPLG